MRAVILGSIGVIAETSDLQRGAFNSAFREAGLDWDWTPEAYRAMLGRSGGQDRIAAHAAGRGQTVDAAALHAAKSRHFAARLAQGVPQRDGVAQAMDWAAGRGIALAFASSTAPDIVDAILKATGLDRGRFAVVLDARAVTHSKPAPDAYRVVLDRLGLAPQEAVAVEDNPDGLAAARAAGISCIAFPGALHDPKAFAGAIAVQTRLDLAAVLPPPLNTPSRSAECP